MRWLARLGVLVLALLLVAGVVGGYFVTSLFPVNSSDTAEPHLLLVHRGASLASVADKLKDQSLIKNSATFMLYARALGWQNRLQSGYYRISPAMNAAGILKKIVEGQSETIPYTIPEGYTMEQASRDLEKYQLSSEKYIQLGREDADQWRASFAFLPDQGPRAGLEGYLFPDTYYLTGSEYELVQLQLKRFKELIGPLWKNRRASHALSLAQTVTLASIVELEGTVDSELPVIADVFLKRLKLGMKLEADPTVEYALKRRQGPKGLSLKDIRIDSPYNTYRYPGLPPAPISNPGRAAIAAVLNPAATPFLYFVARGDGTHVFSRTYQEHLQAIRRIVAGRT